jgi:membrane-associated phospholipid phosphatase
MEAHPRQFKKELLMDGFLSSLIAVNIAFQGLGDWLIAPMQFFSFLGSEDFFLIALPLVYWCINSEIGIRIGVMLLLSNGINGVFKMSIHGPRPFWVSDQVRALYLTSDIVGFGIPSGHTEVATGIWGVAADGVKRTWAWVAASIVILLIGLSRIYFGVHFLHDVLFGWFLGGLTLWIFLKYWNPIAARLKKLTMMNQILLAFAFSMAMILLAALIIFLSRDFVLPAEWIKNAARAGSEPLAPLSLTGMVSAMATLFGLLAGVAWLAPRGGFQASGPAWKRALRYVVGLVGVAVFYIGLKLVFPEGEDLVALVFRYIRYTLVGVWVSAGAPWVFVKLQLADTPNR